MEARSLRSEPRHGPMRAPGGFQASNFLLWPHKVEGAGSCLRPTSHSTKVVSPSKAPPPNVIKLAIRTSLSETQCRVEDTC